MSVNPVLLAFTLGVAFMCIATLLAERRNKTVGAAVEPPPVEVPAPNAGTPPVSPRGGVPTISDERMAVDRPTTAGGPATPHPPKLYATETVELGHGGTKVTTFWYCPKPAGKYVITDQDTLIFPRTIQHDIYAVREFG